MIETYMALIMIMVGNPVNGVSTYGDYYAVKNVQYVASENKTYSIWERYWVQDANTKRAYHYHVEVSQGNRTAKSLVEEAQTRLDAGIFAHAQ
jgi:hypothetical protein